MPLTVDEFRQSLIGADALNVVDDMLLTPGAAHVSDDNLCYIAQSLADTYHVPVSSVEVLITGSAKLGFSLVEKIGRDSERRPRYRAFSASSDIDVAVICPPIFDTIWHELSAHLHQSVWFPPKSGRLGDYLLAGWLRPDHFPKNVRLPHCDAWWDLFKRLSANRRFNSRRVSGGVFYSREHLRQYLSRAVRDCISSEASP